MSARKWALAALALGLLGLLLCLIFATREAVAASLASLLGLAGVPLGGLCLGLSLALVSGSARDQLWPWAVASGRALPVLALMALPMLLGAGALYEWVATEEGGFRGLWLAWPSFAVRSVLYLLLWMALARWVLPISVARPAASGLGLIALVLSISLAAIDWSMSLDSHFQSSLYGLIWFARLMLSGIAFSCLLALAAGANRPGVLRGMLAAAVLAWLYLHFMQYLVIWYGNLPEEIRWYQQRGGGGWLWLTWLLGVGQVLVFVALLWPVSQRPRLLAGLAAATLLLGLAEGVWLSLPSQTDIQPLLQGFALVCAWLAGGGLLALALLPRRSP